MPSHRAPRTDSPQGRPSKTRRKREMLELQKLGEALVELPQRELEGIELPETLREAVMTARRMTKRGAAHRQRQYIGRLMRQYDVEAIRAALDTLRCRELAASTRLHQLERWRERLVEDGDPAIDEFVSQHPEADRQHLRRLIRETRQELAADKPPRAFRALFRYLREVSEA